MPCLFSLPHLLLQFYYFCCQAFQLFATGFFEFGSGPFKSLFLAQLLSLGLFLCLLKLPLGALLLADLLLDAALFLALLVAFFLVLVGEI